MNPVDPFAAPDRSCDYTHGVSYTLALIDLFVRSRTTSV